VKNLDNAIEWVKNGNPILYKFIRFCPHKNNPNIGLSDKDQELLDKLKIQDVMEKEKSKSPTPSPNLGRSSTNYKKPTVKIPPIDIDRSQYQGFSERTQPSRSSTSKKPNSCSYTKNFDKFDFRSLSPINSSASEKANSDQNYLMSAQFHTSSGKIV
jgi:hypothetical protein